MADRYTLSGARDYGSANARSVPQSPLLPLNQLLKIFPAKLTLKN
jgi:hypothetical protein